MVRNTPVFGDPRTDFVFQRIFGSEDHTTALLGFLNDILQLDDAHRITSVALLPPEQRPKFSELKYSIVDVRCVDAGGTTYVVEMQVLNVEAFEKRVVYNVAKAYTNQLGVGFAYPELDDVVGISICDFELWPRGDDAPRVPMLSRWRMAEQHSGRTGLTQIQFVFLELPKYEGGSDPQSLVDKWAYFFREAGNLRTIPEALRRPPVLDALEGARTARSAGKSGMRTSPRGWPSRTSGEPSRSRAERGSKKGKSRASSRPGATPSCVSWLAPGSRSPRRSMAASRRALTRRLSISGLTRSLAPRPLPTCSPDSRPQAPSA